ncbi:MAG: epoxyqueuosine reductase [Bacillota bacterium]|jgi:epoxyqueuosine reductase
MLNKLMSEFKSREVNLVKVVDISMISANENRGYSVAILIGIALSPSYICRLSEENVSEFLEFVEKEHAVDKLAEWTADYIKDKGYKSYAQSERNLINGFYDVDTKTTALPHKKIAMLAGLGWIGKSNLLITHEYGSAFCMCSVLTNAPLPTQNLPIIRSKCGECNICKDICPAKVIHGTKWEEGMARELIVDVYHCKACLKCMINCTWTQRYMKNSIYNQG